MKSNNPAPLWRIKRFCGRKGLGIQGLGSNTVKALYEAGFISDIPDIYDLPYKLAQVAAVTVNGRYIGKKGANRIAVAINRSKGYGLTVLLHALIPHVTFDACAVVSALVPDMKAACRLDMDKLRGLAGMGPATANRFLEYLNSDEARELADNLEKKRVDIASPNYINPEREEIV